MRGSRDNSINQRFSSRWGLILSALGIAVGTGNIWRFPRIAAQNGGEEGAGALIIAWICFLFLWSIPLIIAEYLIGKKQRAGVAGAFAAGIGKRYAWMGAFIAFVATVISFFYAVIVGWALYYFFFYLINPLPASSGISLQSWETFQNGLMPNFFHLAVVMTGVFIIRKGVKSIEKVNKILIPSLLLIILISVFHSLSLEGASKGVSYLFRPQWGQLKDPSIWLQALTQNAWDTGAGWGLFLTYAAYMKTEHGSVKNAFITGIGNNAVSLLMAIMIFGTVFSVMQFGLGYADRQVLEVMQAAGPASTGLTFIWMPQLFGMMPFGRILAIIFFLGLSFAGFSSLMSMLELTTRTLIDRGMKRGKALKWVFSVVFIMGIPSAMNLNFLSNQDFVWGIALMISGAFIAFYSIRYGTDRMRREAANDKMDWKIKRSWHLIMKYFIPPASVALLAWWFYLSISQFAPESWFDPFDPYSIMTCILQWGIILLLLVWFNRRQSFREVRNY